MRFYRNNRKGGGSSIYVKAGISYEVLSEFSCVTVHFESVTIKCVGVLIASIYRPPAGDVKEFVEYVSSILEYASLLNLQIVLVGDFNIDILTPSTQCQQFLDVIESFSCSNVICSPTRITIQSATLIDLCVTSCDKNAIFSGIITFDLSDHLPVFCFFPRVKKATRESEDTAVPCRSYSEDTLHAFRVLIENIIWDDVYSEPNPNQSYDIFLRKVKQCYDNAFPLRFVKKYKKSRKPWVTQELYKKMKARDRLYHKFIQLKDLSLLNKYKKLRNKLNSELRKARISYHTNKFAAISNNPRKIWCSMRSLIGESNAKIPSTLTFEGTEYSGAALADKFNSYFLSCGATSPCQGPRKELEKYISSNTVDSIFLTPCSELEILSFLKSLNRNSAAGDDDIKAVPIIAVADLLCAPLQHICNNALITGIFPEKMKIARVVVLHKGGSLANINNFRPISVLPLFSKVLEHALKIRFNKFLDERQLLVKEQFGFREKKSTEMALLRIKDKICSNIDSKQYTLGLFFRFPESV